MEQSVGAFLLEKATNMEAWLSAELASPLPEMALSELSVTAMSTKLAEHRQLVFNRDLPGLSRQASRAGLAALTEMLEAVRTRRDLHDKFWRYLELFVTTVSDN
jgi:hypothetical protein